MKTPYNISFFNQNITKVKRIDILDYQKDHAFWLGVKFIRFIFFTFLKSFTLAYIIYMLINFVNKQ